MSHCAYLHIQREEEIWEAPISSTTVDLDRLNEKRRVDYIEIIILPRTRPFSFDTMTRQYFYLQKTSTCQLIWMFCIKVCKELSIQDTDTNSLYSEDA